jgi:hypothetical protein
MKLYRAILLAAALPFALAAQAPTAPVKDPITTAFKGRTLGLQRNLAQAFDSIPESKFNYKPTPSQLTIGYIAQHLVSDNILFCNAFGDMKATQDDADISTPDSVKATWPKAKLVSKLKDSFAFCEQAFAQLEDSKLSDNVSIKMGANTRTVVRANMVLGHALDVADHYSQIANYMRLNGMIPPSALPRPRPGSN